MIYVDNYVNMAQHQKSKNIAFARDTVISNMRTEDYEQSTGATSYSSVQNLGTSQETHRSSNIPLPSSHVHRTASELQLRLEEEVAEARDLNMFYRMVNGIREKQQAKDPVLNEFLQTRMRDIHRAQSQPDPLKPELNIPSIVKVHSTSGEDDWSVTGYTAPRHNNDTTEEDDEIFEMDL